MWKQLLEFWDSSQDAEYQRNRLRVEDGRLQVELFATEVEADTAGQRA